MRAKLFKTPAVDLHVGIRKDFDKTLRQHCSFYFKLLFCIQIQINATAAIEHVSCYVASESNNYSVIDRSPARAAAEIIDILTQPFNQGPHYRRDM